MIEIISTPALNTVQDLGRFCARHYGVSTSGVMDSLACKIANDLVGNSENAAVIEVQMFPFAVRLLADHVMAVTGASSAVTLDGQIIPPYWTFYARAGQLLSLSVPRSGSRAYIACAGGIDVPVILGSRSTHLRSGFGGHEGRSLQVGDVLDIFPHSPVRHQSFGVVPPDIAMPPETDNGDLVLRVIRGGDYEIFPVAMQQRFWQVSWKISHQSDRGGYRLSGPELELPAPVELRSYGLIAGIVQVPPSGIPIIQLSDANTAGGYPKIATVIDADIWRLGQARPGSTIRFREVVHKEAVAAMEPVTDYLADIRRAVALYRTM